MRVLLVLSGTSVDDELPTRCKLLMEEGHEVACCYALASGATLQETLDAQRKITARLRDALDASAEAIPVFVVTGSDWDRVYDCAQAWGATDVYA
jgi:hypothetical protein